MKQEKKESIKDSFYKVRKERLQVLRNNVKIGREPMYDFDASMDRLIKELQTFS